jgi:hypothetical protein
MVMLVVMVTTLTTAQEALKQYDGLKAQAREWATLRLLTGFINAYTPPDDSLEAKAATCSASQMTSEPTLPQDAPAQAARSIEARINLKRDAAAHVAGIEFPTPEAEHHNDSRVVTEEIAETGFEHIGEVAMLAETVDASPEETIDDAEETAEPLNSSDDDSDEVATVHTLREARRTDRALNRDLTVIAPSASDAAKLDAALHKTRVASRADAQTKVKVLKRALKVIQIQIEKAAKAELRTSRGVSNVELPGEIGATPLTPESSGGMTARYPPAPHEQLTGRAQASLSTGECAAE